MYNGDVSAFWSSTVEEFLRTDATRLQDRLAHEHATRFRGQELQQLRAWKSEIDWLAASLSDLPGAGRWRILFEYPLLRLGRRIDVVLVLPNAILVLEFKGQSYQGSSAREQVEDYALDLQDFHVGCRDHPILPILVAPGARQLPGTLPLALPGVASVIETDPAHLRDVFVLLQDVLRFSPATLDVAVWEHAAYRPVPTLIEAARMLYSRHGVAEIAESHADPHNLTRTTDAILAVVDQTRLEGGDAILFVTGIPGAGKTLCGLNAVFGTGAASGATFLTGNPTLVHVLREALARDAAGGERGALRAARQRTKSRIQALPKFRDHYVATGEVPAEHVVVIDEAQRSWSGDYAVAQTQDKPVRLTASEPAHLLDIMARHRDWAVIVCLVGGGQEIHTGEGGIAEWGTALAARPVWRVLAAPDLPNREDPRQRLPALPGLAVDPALHLHVGIRSIRDPNAAAWVDAMLDGDAPGAAAIGTTAFRLTRDLDEMRRALRHASRGTRRAGLLASSGAKRLRADGLGAELEHMDAGAVAHWFLDRWPDDVRASDALEVVATEFSCQGLELDHAGMCWAGDLVRVAGQAEWRARAFRGNRWTLPHGAEAIANRRNTYRVLLTRARYQTILWVPRGDAGDRTRQPSEFDAIAGFLMACGVPMLEADFIPEPASSAMADQALLV